MTRPTAPGSPLMRRRCVIAAGGGLLTVSLFRDARATPAEMEAAIRGFVGDGPVLSGRVTLDIPPLVENGNAVPVTVTVASPMTRTDHVQKIALFNEKNPQPNVAVFHLGARSGRAQVATRLRLADTQTITAVAQLGDGSFWSDSAHVIVTLAACIES
ncbi:MAG: SoxY-related AACIE arm protein [Geminicoccaceae bacterium]